MTLLNSTTQTLDPQYTNLPNSYNNNQNSIIVSQRLDGKPFSNNIGGSSMKGLDGGVTQSFKSKYSFFGAKMYVLILASVLTILS